MGAGDSRHMGVVLQSSDSKIVIEVVEVGTWVTR